MSKTIKQTNEFAGFLPIGTIVEVTNEFVSDSFLELNGQKVLKTDYPRLAESLEKTAFDQGEYICLNVSEVLGSMPGFHANGINNTNKLVIKAK